jgi:hypothetical protein
MHGATINTGNIYFNHQKIKSRALIHRREWFVETIQDTQFTTHSDLRRIAKDALVHAFNIFVKHTSDAPLFSCAENFLVS